MPDVAGFLVAPDVWEQLATTIPIVRGSSLSVGGLRVTRVQALPAGAVVPVNAKGDPLDKPTTVRVGEAPR